VQLDQGHWHQRGEIKALLCCNAHASKVATKYSRAKKHIFLDHENLDEPDLLIDHHIAPESVPFRAIGE
jgi:hypothetical protein